MLYNVSGGILFLAVVASIDENDVIGQSCRRIGQFIYICCTGKGESSMLCVGFSGKIERSARTCLEIVYFKGKMRLYKQL